MTTLEHLIVALSLAKKAKRKDIKGNPFVGSIIVDENGAIIGSGYHKKWGEKHAEVFAIEEALLKTADLSNCSLYVTLEPCSHHGKTPPCTDLILKSGIKKVIVGSLDPNPNVSGFSLLQQKGIDISLLETPEAISLNKIFFTNQKSNKPFVRLKMAATLDGKIADYAGASKWITNETSRAYLHAHIRTEVDAIISTAKTVIQDQATLNIRIPNTQSTELNAVIIDRTAAMLESAKASHPIFYHRTETKVFIVTAPGAYAAGKPLPANTEIIETPFNTNGEIDLDTLGKQLLQKGLYSVLVEAGAVFSSYVLSKKWGNELDYFIGSKLLLDANAKAGFDIATSTPLQNAAPLTLLESMSFENDMYLHYALGTL
jgi:diaminohydroxyphosphoribosylaminopyrimidine deaminase/5-amino-6-(5-phosphoribosylamino)uracil reductase